MDLRSRPAFLGVGPRVETLLELLRPKDRFREAKARCVKTPWNSRSRLVLVPSTSHPVGAFVGVCAIHQPMQHELRSRIVGGVDRSNNAPGSCRSPTWGPSTPLASPDHRVGTNNADCWSCELLPFHGIRITIEKKGQCCTLPGNGRQL